MKKQYYVAVAAIGAMLCFAGCSGSTGTNLSRALDGTYYNESGSLIMSQWENGMKTDMNNMANDVKTDWNNLKDNVTNSTTTNSTYNSTYGARTDYETGKVPTIDAPYNQVTTGSVGYQNAAYSNMY